MAAVINTFPNYPMVGYVSDLLDFTAIQTVTLGPSLPGWCFIPIAAKGLSVSQAGSISTAMTLKAGTDASNVNWIPSVTPATTWFSVGAAPNAVGIGVLASSASTADMSNACSLVISTGATGTGGFAWSGRIAVSGLLIRNA